MSSRKRKHSNSPEFDSISEGDGQEFHGGPSLKRRRYDLAGNLSQLSLFEQAHITKPFRPAFQQTQPFDRGNIDPPPDASMEDDALSPAIDVGGEPIPEVRMHNTSSYEPEKDRIIITDLDSSEDEDDTLETSTGSDTKYSVSPVFLSHIKANLSTPLIKSPSPTHSDSSRALVLFKPSPWIAKDSHQLDGIYRSRDKDEDNRELVVEEIVVADVDAMEIE